jgi:hypothetical protein
MAVSWKHDRASGRIGKRLDDVSDPVVKDFSRDMSLQNIPVDHAYKVDGVHLYADIINVGDILESYQEEGVTCHRRALRFLNQHYRAVHRILSECEIKRVDFHNQRLHALIFKPYNSQNDSEAKRVHIAVAVAQLMIDVVAETGDTDQNIPNAVLRIGIDTGLSLAVNNGRSGNREPLFLGRPANQAAKRAGGGRKKGIFLTNEARRAIGLPEVDQSKLDDMPLTAAQVDVSQKAANLPVDKARIVELWRQEMKSNPIANFDFSRPTPPLKNLDISVLSARNSKRMEALSIYGDLDGFTKYVDRNIGSRPEDVLKALHTIRSELDAVVQQDMEGRRIRFVGDCIHGLVMEGTPAVTDAEASVTTATLCAAAMHSSFDICLEKLKDANVDVAGLGLAVGFEYGPMTVTRLGMKGDLVRCSISRGVLWSEAEQQRCEHDETAIGSHAFDEASEAVKRLFDDDRKATALRYADVVDLLAEEEDRTAKAVRMANLRVTAPEVARSMERSFKPHCSGGTACPTSED